MPHIRALFIESESTKAILRRNKLLIRQVVAECTGYSLDEIALIPDMVSSSLADLSDNLLPLEFTIDAGTKCSGMTEFISVQIQDALIASIGELRNLNFGTWLRTMTDNSFIEYKPE